MNIFENPMLKELMSSYATPLNLGNREVEAILFSINPKSGELGFHYMPEGTLEQHVVFTPITNLKKDGSRYLFINSGAVTEHNIDAYLNSEAAA